MSHIEDGFDATFCMSLRYTELTIDFEEREMSLPISLHVRGHVSVELDAQERRFVCGDSSNHPVARVDGKPMAVVSVRRSDTREDIGAVSGQTPAEIGSELARLLNGHAQSVAAGDPISGLKFGFDAPGVASAAAGAASALSTQSASSLGGLKSRVERCCSDKLRRSVCAR